jgi:hypothetical protein
MPSLTRFETIVGLLIGVIAILSALVAITRWVYKQGSSSQKMVNAMDANTAATTELKDSFKLYTEKANGTLLDHERRLTEAQTELRTIMSAIAGLSEKRRLCHTRYGRMARITRWSTRKQMKSRQPTSRQTVRKKQTSKYGY